jgi:hypothetical protein
MKQHAEKELKHLEKFSYRSSFPVYSLSLNIPQTSLIHPQNRNGFGWDTAVSCWSMLSWWMLDEERI